MNLPRILGPFSGAAMLVGLTIGSGIFRVPSSVAGSVGSVGAIALLWVVGGLLALFGGLVMAELSVLLPETGGDYAFLREAYGNFPAFLYGWTRLLLLAPASLGAIALILASYLSPFLPGEGPGERWIAASVILLLTALNARSVLWGVWLENLASSVKVVLLLVLGIAIFALGDGSLGALAGPIQMTPLRWSGFGVALVTVMWTYSGWNCSSALAGEVRDPARDMPLAIIGGILTVLLVYLVVNAAFLFVLPLERMAVSPMVAADAAGAALGPWGGRLISAVVVVATLGALQGSMMFNPRIFFSMGRDGLLPGTVGDVHGRFLTPHWATFLAAALGILYVAFRSFEQLAQAFILGVWPFHMLCIASVYRFRGMGPGAERGYRTWGYPVTPALFLLASVAMILSSLARETALTLLSFGLILTGAPASLLFKRIPGFGVRRGGGAAAPPLRTPPPPPP
jgi:APA family basic amino acid/polyamine antiporter